MTYLPQLHLMADRDMHLRDWFAGQALAGLMSNPEHVSQAVLDVGERNLSLIQTAARYSYLLADAMMTERAK